MLRAFFRFIHYAEPRVLLLREKAGVRIRSASGKLKTDHTGLILIWLGIVDALQEELARDKRRNTGHQNHFIPNFSY